jgi:hypothetical protein
MNSCGQCFAKGADCGCSFLAGQRGGTGSQVQVRNDGPKFEGRVCLLGDEMQVQVRAAFAVTEQDITAGSVDLFVRAGEAPKKSAEASEVVVDHLACVPMMCLEDYRDVSRCRGPAIQHCYGSVGLQDQVWQDGSDVRLREEVTELAGAHRAGSTDSGW